MTLVANVLLVGLSLFLGLRLLRQYLTRPRPHTLYYAIGLLLTALAATPELYFELAGTVPTLLWWLYWASASSLVGFLAVGTAYLMSPRFGKIMLVAVILTTVWVTVASVLTAGGGPGDLGFKSAPSAMIKIPFLIQNIGGSLVILIGAVISFIHTRGLYAILIALGTMVFAAGGSAAGLMKFGEIFAFTQAVGILLLYSGVVLSLKPAGSKAGGGSPERAAD